MKVYGPGSHPQSIILIEAKLRSIYYSGDDHPVHKPSHRQQCNELFVILYTLKESYIFSLHFHTTLLWLTKFNTLPKLYLLTNLHRKVRYIIYLYIKKRKLHISPNSSIKKHKTIVTIAEEKSKLLILTWTTIWE